MLDGTEYFECQCGSPEHALVFNLDLEENSIYTTVFLDQWRPWWHRIWIAIKYVFGYKCMYGHFDCFSMDPKDAYRLTLLLKGLDWQPFGPEGTQSDSDA